MENKGSNPQNDFEEDKKMAEQGVNNTAGIGGTYSHGACPHCGYCPHCGRGGNHWNYPHYPYNPWGTWC